MTRKRIVAVWVPMLAVSLLVLGCPKKGPRTSEDSLETQTTTVAPPPQEVTTPATPSTAGDETEDPLSEDLQTVNQYVTQQGLIGDVYFDFDKYDLRGDSRDRLAKNADFMKQHPEFTFTIEGHADERGTNEYNLALGDRRANAAKEYLLSLGVGANRLRTISYGEERPFCTESSESCWAQNRRAHFVVTGRAAAG